MGRNAAGVNKSGSKSRKGGVSKGRTEAGYTPKMMKNIVGIEQKYRGNRDETLHLFNANGDIIRSFGGKGASVTVTGYTFPQNTILTHNHPRSIGATGVKSIGNSFSQADIKTAINTNAKEMRAVTPRYTFSVKRPSGGWNCTEAQFNRAWNAANREVRAKGEYHVNKHKFSRSSIERAETVHFHRVMQIVSKKFGWDYTKKKG